MNKKHTVAIGNFETACISLSKSGGQLFPARDADGPFIHLCGSRTSTYWPENSRRRGYVRQLGQMAGYDHEHATTGRIARYLLDDIIQSPYRDTYWDRRIRAQAIRGNHWHYLYCRPGRFEYAIEIDLKSAYWTAFAKQPTSFCDGEGRYYNDGGTLEQLKPLVEVLPKPFRLALLGMLAGWRKSYYTRGGDNPDHYGNTLKTVNDIRYGALFNATHLAIIRVYNLMRKLHEIGGDDVIRIHTDGIIFDCCNGMNWEKPVCELLETHGYNYSIKGQGNAWIIDVNTGVLGKKIMGSKRFVADSAREQGVKISLSAEPPTDSPLFKVELSPDWTKIEMDVSAIEEQTALPLGI